jgi:uncharacterized protein YdeI (YjbR/CyaY-like superfamily)
METVIAKDRAEWRRWLAKNFARREEIWLVFYKKGTRKPAVSYDHAVEEALCFGWIDGMKKKLDEQRYAKERCGRSLAPVPRVVRPQSRANYEKFPQRYRRVTAGWVASAKKKLIEFSARNQRITFM